MDGKKEYIERGALIDSFENCYYLYSSTDREIVGQALENAPAADVAPVVHGTWMVLATENHTDAVCSICKKSFYYHNKGQYHIDHSNFCPNCGAKMDGRAHEKNNC